MHNCERNVFDHTLLKNDYNVEQTGACTIKLFMDLIVAVT
jgi:hypothetical protein